VLRDRRYYFSDNQRGFNGLTIVMFFIPNQNEIHLLKLPIARYNGRLGVEFIQIPLTVTITLHHDFQRASGCEFWYEVVFQ
jgi:hypothetical protein